MGKSRNEKARKDYGRTISPHISLADWKTMLLPGETKLRLAKPGETRKLAATLTASQSTHRLTGRGWSLMGHIGTRANS